MMKTRKLNVGDLVATFIGDDSRPVLGMIVHSEPACISYDIEWFCPRPKTHATWKTVQEYRNNYLDFRNKGL